MIHIKDYTSSEVQTMLDNDRDVVIGHEESRVYVKFPESELERELSAKDGIFIAPDHKVKMKNMFPESARKNGMAYSRPKTSKRLEKSGINGMTGRQLQALLNTVSGELVDRADVPFEQPGTREFLETMSYRELQGWVQLDPEMDAAVKLNQTKEDIIIQVLKYETAKG